MNGQLLNQTSEGRMFPPSLIIVLLLIIALVVLVSADQLPVDKKKATPDAEGNIEIVQPDEVQRIANKLNSEISSLKTEVSKLKSENQSLKSEIENVKYRLNKGGL